MVIFFADCTGQTTVVIPLSFIRIQATKPTRQRGHYEL